MLITIENNDERVTIDTAAPLRATTTPTASPASSPAASSADLDAGSAGFDPAGKRSAAAAVPLAAAGTDPMGGGVLDGGACGT